MNKDQITLSVQAGGQSRRMGRNKALVPLAGRPMIEHVLERVKDLADEILITTNQPAELEYLGYRLVSDEQPGAGALPGLKTALAAASGEFVLVVACDMPFLNHSLLRHMLKLAPATDLVVPYWEDNFQTLHAVYRRTSCLSAVQTALARGDRKMISFYPEIRIREILPAEISRFDPDGMSFFNVNTPDDLARAEAYLASSR